jgi:hypothetical protein
MLKTGEACKMQQKMSADEPKTLTNRPVLLDAIDTTLRIIQDRARLYRNLAVAVRLPVTCLVTKNRSPFHSFGDYMNWLGHHIYEYRSPTDNS